MRSAADELETAARQLRVWLGPGGTPPDFPYEFVQLALSRLLEEMSRSLLAGHPMHDHLRDAGLEIARHIERTSRS